MKTLTQAREFLSIAIEDVKHDLINLDFDSRHENIEMMMQFQLLISAKANLDAIAKSGEASQIFKSSIRF